MMSIITSYNSSREKKNEKLLSVLSKWHFHVFSGYRKKSPTNYSTINVAIMLWWWWRKKLSLRSTRITYKTTSLHFYQICLHLKLYFYFFVHKLEFLYFIISFLFSFFLFFHFFSFKFKLNFFPLPYLKNFFLFIHSIFIKFYKIKKKYHTKKFCLSLQHRDFTS